MRSLPSFLALLGLLVPLGLAPGCASDNPDARMGKNPPPPPPPPTPTERHRPHSRPYMMSGEMSEEEARELGLLEAEKPPDAADESAPSEETAPAE